ncbi:MAG: hypothetical protein ABL907_21400 [Hyphomicrobium sp.]
MTATAASSDLGVSAPAFDLSDTPDRDSPSQGRAFRPTVVGDRATVVVDHIAAHTDSKIEIPPFDPKLKGLLDAAARTAQLSGANGTDLDHFMYVAANDPSVQQDLARLGLSDVPGLAERILVQLGRAAASAMPSGTSPAYTQRLASALLAGAAVATAQNGPTTRLSDVLVSALSLIRQATAQTVVDQMVKDALQAPVERPSASELQLRAILEGQAEILGKLGTIGEAASRDLLPAAHEPARRWLSVRVIMSIAVVIGLAVVATVPLLAR